MIPEIIHYGNGNHKRRFAKCGVPESIYDSTNADEVSCITCVFLFLKTSTIDDSKKDKWHKRLKELQGVA